MAGAETVDLSQFVIRYKVIDKHGHELDGDFDPKGRGGCDHRDTPEWKAAHPMSRHKKPAPPVEEAHHEQEAAPQVDAPAAPLAAAAALPASPAAAIAAVGVPDNAISDIKSLIPTGGDAGIVTVILAVVGVAGGGAAWKFYQSHSKNKHEERMKELELQADNQKRDDEREEKCSARGAELTLKVTAVEQRLDGITRALEALDKRLAEAGGGSSLSFDADDLESRLDEIVKRLSKVEGAAKKKGGR